MPEILGSDKCKVLSALTSRVEGTTGYYVETTGRPRIIFSISKLSVVIYNPNRDTITFCSLKNYKIPSYHTFCRSKINITTISQEKNPAVLEAERFLKQS